MVSWVTQTKIVCKSYSPTKLTYQIPTMRVHKTLGISSSRIMSSVNLILLHGVGSFHYFFPWRVLSNSLSSNPNKNRMQKLRPHEIVVPTYHFRIHKNIRIIYNMAMFRVHHSWIHGVGHFHYCVLWHELSNNLWSDPNGDCMKTLHP